MSDRMNLVKKYRNLSVVSKATLWFMICSFVQKGLSFITTPIFTRLMTQEQYGLYGVYTSWLQILTIFATLRLDYSVFYKGMTDYSEDRDGYTSSMLGITSLLTTIMFVIYLCFYKYINSLTELSTIMMCAMFCELYVQAAVNFWSLRERYEFHYKPIVLFTLSVSVFSSVLGVIAVLLSNGSAAARIVLNAFFYGIAGVFIYTHLIRRGKRIWNFKYAKFAILFNLPLIPNYISTYIIDQSDRIMIQKLVSVKAVALYNISYTVGGLVRIFTAALNNTLIPMLYRLLEKKAYKELNKNLVLVMVCVAGLLLAVAACGREVIWILGGEKYMDAVSVIPPIAASVFFSFLYNMLENIELFFGKNKFAVKISFVGVLANVGLNFLLLPRFGYVAAAYTTMISYLICAVGHALYINCFISRQEKIYVDNRILLMGVVIAVCCIALGMLYGFMLLRFAIILVIMIVVFWKRNYILSILRKKTEG